QIADRGRNALTVLAYRYRGDIGPVLPWAILICAPRMAELFQRTQHGSNERRHASPFGTPDAYRTLLAMQFAVEVAVRFELAEIRQAGLPVPAVRTECFPLIVIGGGAAIGH